jgi:tetratricopeptide (TPR) repeat protein
MTNEEVEMYYKQAMTFLGQGDFNKSIEFFDNALDIDNQYSPAWNNKGVALLNLKLYKEALNCFEKVISLNAKDNMVLYNKAYVLLILEEYDLSVQAFDLFLKRYSKKDDFYKFALYLQAKGFYNLKEYQKATELLKKALKKDKNFEEGKELLNLVLKEIKPLPFQ